MEKNRQIGKYILADFLAASVTWLLFNLLRYHLVANDNGFGSFDSYFFHSVVLEGQLFIPFFWLVLFYFSGYYNKPFGKSRLGELYSTFVTVMVGVIFVFFVVVLNDLPHSFRIYYDFFFFL
ncbi:MAG: sugar transferase, partial [Tannerellaceae bacterium]